MEQNKKIEELMRHHKKEIKFYEDQIKILEDQKQFHLDQIERLKLRLME
jgi:hypothetical protein